MSKRGKPWTEARRKAMKSPSQRISERIEYDTNGGCWLWARSVCPDGYGYATAGTGETKAHRLSYEAFIGPIPAGQWVLHRCDVPTCVNPAHLFLGDNAANVADKQVKGRGGQKLNPEIVRSIRASTESSRQVEARLGVTSSMVRRIRRGQSWSHVQ